MARAAPGVIGAPAGPRVTARARRRRRLGLGLIAFGVTGLILVVATAALVLGSLTTVGNAATGFERQRTELVAMLEPASSALSDAAASASHAGTSLTTASDASRRAADLTGRLASAFDAMAALGSFELFGSRPFAGVSTQFTDVAAQSRALSADLATTADALTTNVTDAQAVSANLQALADRLAQLESSLGTEDGGAGSASLPIDLAMLLLLALLAWLAMPAIAGIWLGRRLLRRSSQDRSGGIDGVI